MLWKHGKQGRNLNEPVGFLASNGSRRLTINGAVYQEHIIVWILNTKESPTGKVIHLNGVKSDNRFENLALETKISECKELTQESLKELLEYCTDTGAFTLKVVSKFSSKKVGDAVGYIDKDGYVRIGLNGKTYPAHRLVWLYTEGHIPDSTRDIDHINGDRSNNARSNLRECSRSENLRNVKMRSTNTTGYKGVIKVVIKGRNKFKAQIMVEGEYLPLGHFNTPEEASFAYENKAKELHGEFYRDTTK